MKHYGNTFSGGRENLDFKKVPLWNTVDEIYPGGCTLNNQTQGTTIPAGTAVYVAKMGGEATVYDKNTASVPNGVTGLLLEDVLIGNKGATGTIVTKGSILYKRSAELSSAVKAAVAGRITFIEE